MCAHLEAQTSVADRSGGDLSSASSPVPACACSPTSIDDPSGAELKPPPPPPLDSEPDQPAAVIGGGAGDGDASADADGHMTVEEGLRGGGGGEDAAVAAAADATAAAAAGLSRRQKKNRMKQAKDTDRMEDSGAPARSKKRSLPSREYEQLDLPDEEIYRLLLHYVIKENELRRLGYPMESELNPGKAYIYKDPEYGVASFEDNANEADLGVGVDAAGYAMAGGDATTAAAAAAPTNLDANAKEFVPKTLSSPNLAGLAAKQEEEEETAAAAAAEKGDSDNALSNDGPKDVDGKDKAVGETAMTTAATANNSLSAAAKEFVPQKQTWPKEQSLAPAVSTVKAPSAARADEVDETAKRCVRCNKTFYVTPHGEYLTTEGCVYHWGKLRTPKPKRPAVYTCCSMAAVATTGCSSSQYHVWTGLAEEVGMRGLFDGFVKTRMSRKALTFPGVFSLDCEMAFTAFGLELIKLTVVGIDGRLVYDTLVRPDNFIVDYNTRFSGVGAKDIEKGPVKTLKEVQNDLHGFVNAQSILIGHGLENDLRALKLIHPTVIDTSIVFPHYYALPYRRSLKSLARACLNRDIQTADWGHDSYEDARACAELMLWRVRQDMAGSGGGEADAAGKMLAVAAAVAAVDGLNGLNGHGHGHHLQQQHLHQKNM